MEGGKVIASGTYGCILKPALPCRGETHRPTDTVSKLMIKQHAEDEIKEIQTIFKKVKKVPDFTNYYILDKIKMCQPSTLKAEDLIRFDTKCTAINKRKIMSTTINHPVILEKLRILQLPDGGKDITHYFSKKHSSKLYVKVNTAIIKLLKGGIVPLSGINVLHQDIKSSNIVYSEKSGKARLIDWGLSTNIIRNTIPNAIRGWPLMFNQPFTNLLFHKQIQKLFEAFRFHSDVINIIRSNPGSNLKELLLNPLQQTLMSIIFIDDNSVIKSVGNLGHVTYLESLLKTIVNLKLPTTSPMFVDSVNSSPFKTLGRIVSTHMATAFLEYSIVNNKIGVFRENDFFNNVYRNNCDVFGFISNYIDILMNRTLSLSVRGKGYFIVEKYLINPTYSATIFPIEELINDCHSLNYDFIPGVRHTPPKSIEQPKAPIMISQSLKLAPDDFSWELMKRCPKGTHRNKKTGKCQKKLTKTIKKKCPPGSEVNPKTGRCNKIKMTQKKKRRRCPNGHRYNPKTRNCDPK